MIPSLLCHFMVLRHPRVSHQLQSEEKLHVSKVATLYVTDQRLDGAHQSVTALQRIYGTGRKQCIFSTQNTSEIPKPLLSFI